MDSVAIASMVKDAVRAQDDYHWRKFVEVTGFCWHWTGAVLQTGYGQACIGRRRVYAHRWAYEVLVGPIPTGMELDHLCRIRRCVNPDHLEPVTHRENTLRGYGPAGIAVRRTVCPVGHDYVTTGRRRRCYTCENERRGRRRDEQ